MTCCNCLHEASRKSKTKAIMGWIRTILISARMIAFVITEWFI